MRRLFQIALIAVSLPPLVFGTLGVVNGASPYVSPEAITPDLDSLIRFSGAWYTFAFFFAVWVVFNLERAGQIMIIGFTVMAAGGCARLFSAYAVGMPGTGAIIATCFQLGLLAFIPWHRAVIRPESPKPV